MQPLITKAVTDSVGMGGGAGDPASSFLAYLMHDYVTSPLFQSMILVIFLLLWIARVFIFDNKNIKLNTTSWFYPLMYFVIVAFVVWLKGGIEFVSFKKYLSDFITQIAATSFLYMIFGHKLIAWASQWAGTKLGLYDIQKSDVSDLRVPN
jgi:hypothetical protein